MDTFDFDKTNSNESNNSDSASSNTDSSNYDSDRSTQSTPEQGDTQLSSATYSPAPNYSERQSKQDDLNSGDAPQDALRDSQRSIYVPAAYFDVPSSSKTTDSIEEYQKRPEKKKSGKKVGKIVGCIVAGIAAIAVISASSILIYNRFFSDSNVSGSDYSLTMYSSPKTDTTITGDEEELTAAQIAAKVRPSIVSVITEDTIDDDEDNSAEGSGIILTEDGYIVTNSHVIGDSKKYDVTVITSDGDSYDATVVGYDTRSDLAVLKINASGLTACELGDSSQLVLGDYVMAIGNPGGVQFAGSVTDGIVSGVDRIIDTTDMESTSAMRYIQTNAAINPGNSGGALVNIYGQVIGVNTSKITADGYEGMGFAIPSVTVKEVAEDLISYGYVKDRVKLGITCITISSAYESEGIPAGLQIYSIESGSDLNGKAEVYDIITYCDGNRVEIISQLQDVLYEKKPGDTVELTLFNPTTSTSYTITVTLLEDVGEEEESTESSESEDSDSDSSSDSESENSFSEFFEKYFGGNSDKDY